MIRCQFVTLLFAIFAVLGCGSLMAASLNKKEVDNVSPATLHQALNRASGGDTIVLPPDNYGTITFPRRKFSPSLTLKAEGANFSGIILSQTSGITIEGGTIIGPGERSYGVSIRDARNIRIANMTISGAHRGIVVNHAEDVVLMDNILIRLISDGINVAYSHHIRIERNKCIDFKPNFAVYDSDGKRLRDGDHPDCIQVWSRPQFAPTSDLTIIGNQVEGQMQGIFLGNHVRNGVDDGGFDRVVIRDNVIQISMPNGIVATGVRGGDISGNIIRTVPGAKLINRPDWPVRAKLLVKGTDVRACDNKVEAVPNNQGQVKCQ